MNAAESAVSSTVKPLAVPIALIAVDPAAVDACGVPVVSWSTSTFGWSWAPAGAAQSSATADRQQQHPLRNSPHLAPLPHRNHCDSSVQANRHPAYLGRAQDRPERQVDARPRDARCGLAAHACRRRGRGARPSARLRRSAAACRRPGRRRAASAPRADAQRARPWRPARARSTPVRPPARSRARLARAGGPATRPAVPGTGHELVVGAVAAQLTHLDLRGQCAVRRAAGERRVLDAQPARDVDLQPGEVRRRCPVSVDAADHGRRRRSR